MIACRAYSRREGGMVYFTHEDLGERGGSRFRGHVDIVVPFARNLTVRELGDRAALEALGVDTMSMEYEISPGFWRPIFRVMQHREMIEEDLR